MIFQFNRYRGLSLVFFIHGLVYAILLFRRGFLNDRSCDKWLAAFLFLCMLYFMVNLSVALSNTQRWQQDARNENLVLTT